MKRVLLVLICCIQVSSIFACTTFCLLYKGQILFGRNYDWVADAGIVYSNQRGMQKTSHPNDDGGTISWVAQYGSITFNQYGKEFPTGGMNEKGLVVELMWLNETKYPGKDNRASLDVLQWVQYQLDNASNVADVIASDKKIRISANETPLHYLVADANGNTATIEFLDGKMIVHKDKELPYRVLTNSTYEESASIANNYFKTGNNNLISDNSIERFVKACNMVQNLDMKAKSSLTDYSFSILDKVSQGDYTKWSIVYDIIGKKIHFKTNRYKQVKTIDFSGFDFSCRNPSVMFNMNQLANADVTKKFSAPDLNLKNIIANEVIRDSRSRINLSEKHKKQMLEYENSVVCAAKK